MENENEIESLIYSSQKFSYQPIIKTKINMKNKNKDTDITETNIVETKPQSVFIYDHNEYVQVDIIYKNKGAEDQIPQAFINGLNLDLLRCPPHNMWAWITVQIIPNPISKSVYMELTSLENLSTFINKENDTTLVSFCSATKLANIVTDNTDCMDYKNMNNIVEYNVVSKEEMEIIKEKVFYLNQLNYQHSKFEKSQKILSKIISSITKTDETTQTTRLIDSLNMTEQEKRIFDENMLNVSIGATDSEQALNDLIGLENVKTEIRKLKAKLRYRKKQKDRKIFVENTSSMHMCFTGAPGTGKTTVARIITGILYNMGYIKENKCIEINGQNLKGGYTGQTAIIAKLVMKSAKNKVLFIDEAYALFDEYENGFGKEAIAVILKEMEDERDNTVVIFAGYKDDIEQFLTMNSGLKSRINRYIHFDNYSIKELTDILVSRLKSKKLYITEPALEKCILAFKKAQTSERFSNARFVRNMLEKIEYEHAYNTHNTKDIRRQDTIEVEDVPDELIDELLTRSM